MKKKGYKGRCEKRVLSKCTDVCRTYNAIQFMYAEMLQEDTEVKEFSCNVLLDGLTEGEYVSDFVCTRVNGDMFVRECVERRLLTKPLTAKLLDLSRVYWLKHGLTDWGIVINEE